MRKMTVQFWRKFADGKMKDTVRTDGDTRHVFPFTKHFQIFKEYLRDQPYSIQMGENGLKESMKTSLIGSNVQIKPVLKVSTSTFSYYDDQIMLNDVGFWYHAF